MTNEQLNKAIEAGTKKYGSKSNYLKSTEYSELYAKWKATPKTERKTKEAATIEFSKEENGFIIKISGGYLCHIGGMLGFGGGGAMSFTTKEEAIQKAVKCGLSI